MEQTKCKKDRHSSHSVTLWHVGLIVVAAAVQECTAGAVELHVTANYINILNTEQQCFYNKFMSSATITPTWVSI